MDVCSSKNMNQGMPKCLLDFGIPAYFFSVAVDVKIPAETLKSPFAYIRENTMEPDPQARWYIVPRGTKRVTDNSTEATVGTLDMGYSKKLVDGRFVYLLEWPSDFFGDRNIYRFDGYTGGIFILNKENVLWGLRNADGSMSPYPCEISVDGGGFSGSGGDVNTVKMTIDIGEKNKVIAQSMFTKLSEKDRVETLQGFRDLEILELSVGSGVATVQLVTGGDNVNMFGSFNEAFSDAANWRVDGQEATAVVADPATRSYKITVTAGTHEICTAPVDVLMAAGVVGFEGVAVAVTLSA
jgi:hypothetical protein